MFGGHSQLTCIQGLSVSALRFIGIDRRAFFQCQANVIQPVHQAMFAEGVERELELMAVWPRSGLANQRQMFWPPAATCTRIST